MTQDRSLDEFLASADAEDEAGEDDAGDEDAPEAVAPTASSSPGGAPCAACGTVVERRWRDGGEMVCAECKEW